MYYDLFLLALASAVLLASAAVLLASAVLLAFAAVLLAFAAVLLASARAAKQFVSYKSGVILFFEACSYILVETIIAP